MADPGAWLIDVPDLPPASGCEGRRSTQPAECPEIDRGPSDDPPGSVDYDAESSIAVVERQPVKPGVLANALFAFGRNLA